MSRCVTTQARFSFCACAISSVLVLDHAVRVASPERRKCFVLFFSVLLSYICVKFCPVIQFDRCIKGVRCERRAQRDVK